MKLFEIEPNRQDQLAITDLSRHRTWRELEQHAFGLAAAYHSELGLQPGDHVALQLSNRVEFIEALLAGIIAGLWVTPINTHLTTDEAAGILVNSDARLLIFDKENAELANHVSNVQALSVENERFERWLGQDGSQRFFAQSPAGGTMLYTSGTTGHPKGVMRAKSASLGEALDNMKRGGRLFGLLGEGPHLVTGPLYHAAPMLFALYDLLNGSEMVIMPRWDVGLFHRCVRDYGITTTHLVPTMMVRLLKGRTNESSNHAAPEDTTLALVLHGAAPIGRHTKEAMLAWWGDILVEYWGGSEAGVTTLCTSDEWRKKPGTVGRALPHFEVYIGDSDGNPVKSVEGELFCRHRDVVQVFSYYKDPEKTRRAHPQPYIFSIGDSGYVDPDGYVFLSGRRNDLILSGGVNIYPAEIEQALLGFDLVQDCAVLGIPDPEWGERVVAVIELQESDVLNVGDSLKEAQLIEEILTFLAPRLARFKMPREFRFVTRIPRMATGKIKQSALRGLIQ